MNPIPPPLRRLLHWTALGLAALCAVATLAGQGGRWSARLDVLNQVEAAWLVLAVLALALWLAAGRTGRWTPALAGAAVIVAGLQMGPEILAGPGRTAPAAGAERLKIIQFNAWSRNVDPTGTLRWVLAQNADVVVLEEALGSHDVVHGLTRAYPYRRTCEGLTYCEIDIFSRAKPIAWAGLSPSFGLPGAWAMYPGAGGPFVVGSLHAPWPWPPGPQQFENALFAKALQGLPRDRMIVTGDFNSTPWSFSLRRLDQLLGLRRRTHGIASWPARAYHGVLPFDPPFPLLPIDQVYAGKGWRTVSITRGPRLGSDHYPLVVVLEAAR